MSDSKIEKVVYLVRHGESEHNTAPVFQSPDSPLSKKGQMQAENVSNRIFHLSFEALISSTLQRAKETAEIISRKTNVLPEHSDLFRESVAPTKISGKSYEDNEASIIWHRWEDSLYASGLRVEDGENFDDLMIRAEKALKYLKDRPEKAIVVITHGFFLRTLISKVLLGDLLTGETFKMIQRAASSENTGLSVLRYQTGFEEGYDWRLWTYNDHAHLAE